MKQLGVVLGVWAHPDDETFCAGGLLAMAAANGQTVVNVTATRGEAGVQDPTRWPVESLGQIREQELEAALQILGAPEHTWLPYKDGHCADISDDEASAQLMLLIEKYQPDTIVTFPPNGLTGHPDHQTVSRWAKMIAAKSTKPVKVLCAVTPKKLYENHLKEMDDKLNVYFNLDEPELHDTCDLALRLSGEVLDKKLRAWAAMPSQTAHMLELFPEDYLRHAFAEEWFITTES